MNQRNTALVAACLLALVAGCGGADPDAAWGRQAEAGSSDSCIEQRCGSELDRCDSTCGALLQCVSDCSSDSCADACIAVTPDYAVQQAGSLAKCYQQKCSDTGSSSGSSSSTSSGTSTAAINRCIDGLAVMCGCLSAADAPCTTKEKDNGYNQCVGGASSPAFDYLYCIGGYQPNSLDGCLTAFNRCEAQAPQQ
jgi:hypothetical protein